MAKAFLNLTGISYLYHGSFPKKGELTRYSTVDQGALFKRPRGSMGLGLKMTALRGLTKPADKQDAARIPFSVVAVVRNLARVEEAVTMCTARSSLWM